MTIKLKTNVKCGACLAAVTPELDQIENASWEVDLSHPDRVLTVYGNCSVENVKKALEKAGYKGETM